ncbi:MAG: exo-alpha-sialidase [Actinobacteria bacterium]|nr:MAG: exo-alpha-sialidase [Actinomycetota bacterium]
MRFAFSSLPKRLPLAVALAATAALVVALSASANVSVTIIATDPFTNPTSQHATIVEPDTYSFGSSIVAASQWGRFTDGGASDIGVSVSTNNGTSWTAQALPGITGFTNPPGPYARVSDPSVAYDARHQVWMVSSLALDASVNGAAVILSRSTNGGATWNNPVNVAVAGAGQDFDKNWTVCDNDDRSTFYGSCYTQWDDFGHGNLLKIAYSRDGGLTWKLSKTPRVGVIGGQPLTLPNGNVVVPIDNASETALGYTRSTNGGVKFGQAFTITSITAKADPGNIRSGPLPSAEISNDGKIYVVWEDCRFRSGCSQNDLVYVTSTNGTTWSAVQRIPIDSIPSTADYFIPGVAVDKGTLGANIHVAVEYYYYPNVNCTFATCQLDVGYISSTDGGSTWSAAQQLRGPMTMSWLPDTTQGRMVGDYMSTSFDDFGLAHPVFAEAYAPPTGDCVTSTPLCNQPLEVPTTGLPAAAGANVANDPVVYTAPSNPGAAAFRIR